MRPPDRFIPHYVPGLSDQYRFEQERRRRRNGETYSWPPGSGGDAGGGVVISVDGQSKADYDKMIKDNFRYTQDNYGEAYKEAASKGLPVVAIFGGWERNNSRSLIQESLPLAKQGAGKEAIYIYVDRARCKDKELAKFADSQLAGGHNAAVSIVFSVKPDENGKPTPEPYTFRWQGGHESMIASFNQSIQEAKAKMESYNGRFTAADAQPKAVRVGEPKSIEPICTVEPIYIDCSVASSPTAINDPSPQQLSDFYHELRSRQLYRYSIGWFDSPAARTRGKDEPRAEIKPQSQNDDLVSSDQDYC